MKSQFVRKIVLIISFTVSLSAFAEKVPFKYPKLTAPAFSQVLSEKEKVVVILGAGPSGLLAALLMEQNGYFVVLVEQRAEFSRNNTLSTQPESIPMLKRLGVFDAFIASAIFAKNFHLFVEKGPTLEEIKAQFPGNLETVNYSLPVAKVLNPALWSHYAIELTRLQFLLSARAIASENIVLLHGTGNILVDTSTRRLNSVHIKSLSDYSDFVVNTPNLIIVAEGAHSRTRDEQLKISFNPTVPEALGGGKEYWCSGSVSLTGIRPDDRLFGHISLVVNPPTGLAVWGVFRPEHNDLFLNGQAPEPHRPYLNAEDCLQENAFRLLRHEEHFLQVSLPASPKLLKVSSTQTTLFELTLKKAEHFHSGYNTVLFGDAAGNGSPRGGLGWSLASTVYLDALEHLIRTPNREEALEAYNRRLSEIVHHWHFSMKDGTE